LPAITATLIADLTKKLFIKTYGCQMNVYDSARMADVLAPYGYVPTQQVEEADMVILNTCHIREKAAEKVYSELGRVRRLKDARREEGGDLMIAVAGCVAQAEGEEMKRRAPFVDLIFGPQVYHRLPELISKAERGKTALDTDFPLEDKFDNLPEESSPQGPAAFLTIQEGCDKFCAFCVVPYTRGAEFSRPAISVLAEARRLIGQGTREITVLGQNVNAYHGEAADGSVWGLGRLIRALAEIDGLDRIRYTTSHPRDMDDDLISAHADVPQLMPYLHLPVQSGSDTILDAMNRQHTVDFYYRIIERLRIARPDIALSSDFIVGFPGESDIHFADTLKLVREIEFAQAYSFKYSTRAGTPAATGLTQVPEETKKSRLATLQQLLGAQQAAFNHSKIGAKVPVLLDRRGKRAGQLVGRSPWLQAVHVEADETAMGTIVEPVILSATMSSLEGQLSKNQIQDEGISRAVPGAERNAAA
jgi:tRNA-2-methylthio-N6-dimethylallyladenosine synthase